MPEPSLQMDSWAAQAFRSGGWLVAPYEWHEWQRFHALAPPTSFPVQPANAAADFIASIEILRGLSPLQVEEKLRAAAAAQDCYED